MFLGKLFAVFGRFGTSASKAPVVQVDLWEQFSKELPAKLAWAHSIDVTTVAVDAASSLDRVETLAGYPSLWLEFGSMIQSSERATLETALALGRTIFEKPGKDSELWAWYQAYMRSPCGRGEIMPKEWNVLSRDKLRFLGKIINFATYIGSRLKTYETFRDYYDAVKVIADGDGILPDDFYQKPGDFADVFEKRKDELLNAAYAACRGYDDLVGFFRSTPRDTRYTPFWMSTYNILIRVGSEISDIVKAQIKNAKTSAEVDQISIPHGIVMPHIDFSWRLAHDLKERRDELLRAEEDARVRAHLKANG